MVQVDKEYEFVSQQLRFHIDKIFETFKLYIQLFSVIVGGSIWLSFQHELGAKARRYEILSDWLVVLLAVVGCALVFEHWRAWRSNRSAQSRLGGKDETGKDRIPGPSGIVSVSSLTEAMMVLAMIITAVGFCRYNPFAPM